MGLRFKVAVDGERLEALFVRPELWGQGLGRELLTQLFETHDCLTLHVYKKNERATAFYVRQGFSAVGEGRCPFTGQEELEMVWRRNKKPSSLDNDEG